MRCPYCNHLEDKVLDSREKKDGSSIRRRRECIKCNKRFTTYERIEEVPLMIIKKDNKREPFDRHKLLNGLLKACEKRPVPMDKLEAIVDNLEQEILDRGEKEVFSNIIGEYVMNRLHELDDVAYVRFASVYRQFRDLNQFMEELKDILNKKTTT